MKLIDMKRSKSEMKKADAPEVAGSSKEKYPWGLSINLEKESLSKLGIDIKKVKIGSAMTLQAQVEVSSISENQNMEGRDNKSMSLQITNMALSAGEGPSKSQKFFNRQKAGPGDISL